MGRLYRWTVGAVASALLAVGLPAVSMPAVAGAAAGGHVLPTGDGGWKGTPAPTPSPFSWRSPKGKDAPLVKSDPRAKRVKELTDRRTQNASFFRMSDGSVQEVLSAVPVHYRDARGVWQDIDPSVVSVRHAGFTAGSVGNSFQTFFGSTASSLVRVEQGAGSIQVGLDGAHVGAPRVSGDTVSYPNALPGADLSYQSSPDGLMEKIVLAKPLAAGTVFTFTAKVSGFTPRQLQGGAIAFYGSESNNPVFTIPAPYMADSKRDANSPYGFVYSSRVTQSMSWDAKTGILRLTVTPDASWLASAKRVYPVTIDPTIVVSSTSSVAANVMILKDGPSTNYDTSWRLSVGTTTTGAARSLIKFVLPTVPAGTVLTSADLQLFYDQTFTTGSNNVPMQALAANAAWNPATATWNNASSIGGPLAGATQMTANQLGVWNDFPVTSTVQSWLSGTLANNGFVLKATNEATLGQGGPRYEGAGYYYNGEVKNYPKLVINYGVPGVTVNPPSVIHSTGAELSWPAYTNNTGNSANDIAEYQVHRSIYQTFTPTASTEISPVTAGTTSFVDSTAVPTPANNSDPYGNAYYYMVVVKTKSGQLIPGPTTVVRLPEAGRTTLLIPTQSATTLSSTEPTTVLNTLSNAGTPQPWLEVGDNSPTYGTARSILNFPSLSAIPPGSTILDAHLKLWQETTTTTSSGAIYEVHALTRAFTGSQATWNAAATGTNWTTPGGDYNAAKDGTVAGLTNDPNRQNFDATSIVQGWVNSPSTADGLLIKLAAETTSSPQERTVFAGPNTAEPALQPTLVITYLDTSTGSTYYAPSTPTDMNPGTTYSVPVTLNNTTTATWAAASEVLTYHWTLPDGTDITAPGNQRQTLLPNDLAPAATITLNAQVTPPTPTDGNQAEGATLAWDMYNKTTGTYLSGATTAALSNAPMSPGAMVKARQTTASGGGTGSLSQQVSVDPTGNNQLGLEKFYPYVTTPTGSGSNLYSNTASGNTVWNDDLFSNPSVGFDTMLRLSYNSLSTMDTTTGFGWSIEASAPVRLGQALQFHPPSDPTSMVMVDGTGNAHQWNLVNGTWQSPPGVHLFLQGTACKPNDPPNAQAWKMTRPDRTTYYFDCEGSPTKQIDPNGNEADFSYSDRQSENKPEEFLDHITDPMGRQTLTLTYYNKGDSYSYIDTSTSSNVLTPGTNLTDPAIIDHVKSITDVAGRTVDFYYTSQGLLGQVVDGAGTSIAKTFNFTYDATQGMKNVKLVTVQDPRGNSTGIAYYPTSSPTKWWTQQVTDRMSKATGFAYTQPGTTVTTEATVTDANGGKWVYDTDSAGRLTKQIDPAITATLTGATTPTTVTPTTTIGWDSDNNVNDLKENNGAETKWSYDAGTGLLADSWDAVTVKSGAALTDSNATHYTLDTSDSADTTLSGHIGFVDDVTTPKGYRTQYTYYPLNPTDQGNNGNPGNAGNLDTVQAPDGTAVGATNPYITGYTYDALGELASVKDANDNTTTYSYTKYIGPGSEQVNEPTGQPLTVVDPMSNITTFVYGPRGEVTSTTDPADHISTASYDVFLRPTGGQVPKDQASGAYVVTPAPVYDGNDNVKQSTAPYITGFPVPNSTTTTVFDKDDRPSTVTLPANSNAASPAPRNVVYGYDNVGNQTTVTEPLGTAAGVTAGTAASYTTTTVYNAVNEVTATDWLAADGSTDKTQFSYNDVGDRITATDPRGNTSTTNYDLDHRVASTIDAAKNTTSVGYDLDGRVISTTDQNNTTTNYTLDPNGQITQVQVPHDSTRTDVTDYTYDQVGNNLTVVSPRGMVYATANNINPDDPTAANAYTTSTKYDKDNRKTNSYGAYLPGDANYDSNNRPETDYSYDAAGRLTKVDQITKSSSMAVAAQRPDDHAVTTFDYYDNGWTKDSTDPFNIKTAYDYNGLGKQTSRALTSSDGIDGPSGTGAPGSVQRDMNWDYNPDGSLQSYSDNGLPGGWDNQVITADGGSTQFDQSWTKGGNGYSGSTYYQGSGPTAFEFDVTVPQDGDYDVYVYYSTSGDPNASYLVSSFNGGSSSAQPGTTVPVNQTQNVGNWQPIGTYTFHANSSGQWVNLLPNAAATPAVADAIRLVRHNTGTSQSRSLTYSYDPNGNLSDIADASPDARFNDYTPTFNNINQLSQLQEKLSGNVIHTLTWGYDQAGNLTKQTQDTTSGTYTYNNLNQLSTVLDKASSSDPGITVSYDSYTPTGRLAKQTKGFNSADANNNITNTTADVVTDNYNLDGTLKDTTETAAADGSTVDKHALTYDENDNVIGDQTTVQKTDLSIFTRGSTLAYSPNNQVTSVGTGGEDDQSYQYDSSGGVIKQSINNVSSQTVYTHGRPSQVINAQGQQSGIYQYDTFGRLSAVISGASYFDSNDTVIGQRYTYDGFDDILTQSQTDSKGTKTTSYIYDSLGRPTNATISAGSSEQSETIDYLGSSKTVADEQTSTVTKTYDYSPNGQRLALINRDTSAPSLVDQPLFYTYNPHQDVEALTLSSGLTHESYGYSAYGVDDPKADSGMDTGSDTTAAFPFNPYRFNSGRVATTTDNLDMGFRTYDPNTNSFISRDTYNGPGADASLSGGSRYGFAGGNPISNIEADGHGFWSTVASFAGVAAGYGLCNLALDAETFGAGVAICGAIVGGILGGGASQGVDCLQGGSCSPGAFAANIALTAGTSLIFSGVAAGLGGLLPDSLSGVAKGAIANAAGGASGYGVGCAIASDCSWSGLATATLTAGTIGGAFGAIKGSGVSPQDLAEGAAERAEEIQNSHLAKTPQDDIAFKQRMVANVATDEGINVIGGGARDIDPAQRGMLGDGEVPAKLPNEHGEVTAVTGAIERGLTPRAIGTSKDFCDLCELFLQETGAIVTGPRTAIWPQFGSEPVDPEYFRD